MWKARCMDGNLLERIDRRGYECWEQIEFSENGTMLRNGAAQAQGRRAQATRGNEGNLGNKSHTSTAKQNCGRWQMGKAMRSCGRRIPIGRSVGLFGNFCHVTNYVFPKIHAQGSQVCYARISISCRARKFGARVREGFLMLHLARESSGNAKLGVLPSWHLLLHRQGIGMSNSPGTL
jgi:hypothetical protein